MPPSYQAIAKKPSVNRGFLLSDNPLLLSRGRREGYDRFNQKPASISPPSRLSQLREKWDSRSGESCRAGQASPGHLEGPPWARSTGRRLAPRLAQETSEF